MAASINRVVLVGNLTRDPELRHTPSGTPVLECASRSTRGARTRVGNWTDKPNYFDVTVWGQQAENCSQYLARVAASGSTGRLEWREWEAQDGNKRRGSRGRRRQRAVPGRTLGRRESPRVRPGRSHCRRRRRLPALTR